LYKGMGFDKVYAPTLRNQTSDVILLNKHWLNKKLSIIVKETDKENLENVQI
jgi:hypothetical protein